MSARHQELLFNLAGQSFYFDPLEGQPSGTPTVAVYRADSDDTSTAVVATTGACSVDSVATTFGATAAVGDTAITVASGTGITVGRRYLVANAGGEREWVEVKSVASTAVGLRRPLLNDYTTAGTFKGCRISIGVDPAWMAAVTNLTEWTAGHAGYRLRWSYTVSSVARLGVSFADLVRYSAKNLVTALDVESRSPGWIDSLPSDYQEDQGAELIAESFQAVRFDALGDDQVLRRVRSAEVLRELVILKAVELGAENAVIRGATNTGPHEMAKAAYDKRYAQLLREPKVPVDEAGGGAGGKAARSPLWRR